MLRRTRRFQKTQSLQVPSSLTTNVPVGTFLKTEKGYFYVTGETKRLRFISDRVLDSWSPQRIVELTEANPAVEKLVIKAKMLFRDGSLLYSHANGKMYLISEHKRRPIENLFVLDNLGATLQDAVWVSQEEINLHEEGAPLT